MELTSKERQMLVDGLAYAQMQYLHAMKVALNAKQPLLAGAFHTQWNNAEALKNRIEEEED